MVFIASLSGPHNQPYLHHKGGMSIQNYSVMTVDPKIYTKNLIVIGSSIQGRNNVRNDILITQRYNQV